MATSVWKGQISFGMVSFPVKLCAAARTQAVRFHQLHPCASTSRIKQVLYCRAEDKPVPRADLVKGFEYDRDRYVVVEEHELRRLAPPSSRVMEVREFVPAGELDPVYLDASYYVAPQDGGEKPYTLLFEALRRSSRSAGAMDPAAPGASGGVAAGTMGPARPHVVLPRGSARDRGVPHRDWTAFRAGVGVGAFAGERAGGAVRSGQVSGPLPGESAGADRFQDPGPRAKTGSAACAGSRAGHSAALQASLHVKQGAAGPPGRKGPRQAIREAAHSKQAPAPSLVPPKNPRVLAR
jgi:Ku70/Ku80 beta-barrel domain